MECVNYVAVSVNCSLTLGDETSVLGTFTRPSANRFRTLGIRWRVWQAENHLQDLAIGTKLDMSHRYES